jgi:hypothetical protein
MEYQTQAEFRVVLSPKEVATGDDCKRCILES